MFTKFFQPLRFKMMAKQLRRPSGIMGGRFYTTVRTRESMLKMPFTNHGFSFYDTDKWKTYIDNATLIFIGEYPTNEPVLEFGSNKLMLQSLCVIAGKNKF